MKKLFLSLSLILVVLAGKAQTLAPSGGDVLELKQSSFDFGKIQQGRPVTHVFEIVNTGKDSLMLENVRASCGCTTPEWTHDAIAPGATSPIKVGYNAMAEGTFSKTVTIFYDQNKTKIIHISGTVYRSPATSAPVNPSLALLKQNN